MSWEDEGYEDRCIKANMPTPAGRTGRVYSLETKNLLEYKEHLQVRLRFGIYDKDPKEKVMLMEKTIQLIDEVLRLRGTL